MLQEKCVWTKLNIMKLWAYKNLQVQGLPNYNYKAGARINIAVTIT